MPVGDVVDHRSGTLIAGPRSQSASGFVPAVEALVRGEATEDSVAPAMSNTTIGVVATDGTLTKEEANWLARVSHDGLALAIRPCHTPRDGDTLFGLATNQRDSPGDLTTLGAAAVEVTAQAVLRAVQYATGLGGIPAVSELDHEH